MGAAWLSPLTDPAPQAGPSYHARVPTSSLNENNSCRSKPRTISTTSRCRSLRDHGRQWPAGIAQAVPAYPDQRAQADQRTAAPSTDRRTVRGFGTRRSRGSRHRIELLPAAPVRALGRQRNANRLVISANADLGCCWTRQTAFIESRRDDGTLKHAWSTAILATWSA